MRMKYGNNLLDDCCALCKRQIVCRSACDMPEGLCRAGNETSNPLPVPCGCLKTINKEWLMWVIVPKPGNQLAIDGAQSFSENYL